MPEQRYELVKFVDDGFELEVNVSPEEDTVWLSKSEMAMLFDRDRSVVSKHVKNILDEHECDFKSNVHFLHVANSDKPVEVYSLDVVISVGYRVKSQRGVLFRKWANSILRQYLLKGYAINTSRVLVTPENYLDLVCTVNRIDANQAQLANRLEHLESSHPELVNRLFFKGELWDATSLLEGIVSEARKSIILIDSYIDRKTLDVLSKKKEGVGVSVYTSPTGNGLSQKEIFDFRIQYGSLEVKTTNEFHDRFLILDFKKLYHIGASIKDAGKRAFEISCIDDEKQLEAILERLKTS